MSPVDNQTPTDLLKENSFSNVDCRSDVLPTLVRILDRLTANSSNAAYLQIPPPDKFSLGGNFYCWQKQTENYLKRFPAEQHSSVILSLLSGEAFVLAAQSKILDSAVSCDTFARLRRLLDTPNLPFEYRREFNNRRQQHNEAARTFVHELMELAVRAFDNEDEDGLEKRVLEQFVDGVSSVDLKREFVLKPPSTLEEAVNRAEMMEKLDRAFNSEQHTLSFNDRRPPKQRLPTQLPYAQNAWYPQGRSKAWGPSRTSQKRFSTQKKRQESYHTKSVVPAVSIVNSLFPLMMSVVVGGVRTSALLDTGASRSLLSASLARRLRTAKFRSSNDALVAANGSWIQVDRKVFTQVESAGHNLEHNFIVCPNLSFECIFGLDLLRRLGNILDLNTAHVRQSPSENVTEINTIMTNNHEEELKLLCSNIEPKLEPPVREQLEQLLIKYKGAFALNDGQLGRTSVLQHEIHTSDTPPVRIPPRRIPSALIPELNSMIENMLKKNIIQPSSSPWSSPVVLVKKKNGDLRLCVDYRKLNEVTRRDAFPLPRIDDLFDALAGARFFSTLDLASGYWQVEVKQEDRPKTAFSVPSGLYEFQTMPFGLVNAPATFQRLMQKVLQDLVPDVCLVYLDDVIVLGKTIEEHLSNLEKVLTRISEVGLTLKPTKCHFLCPEVCYLGHIVSADGVRTDPTKVSQVLSWPKPGNLEELRSFLGLASYYRRFIHGYASITEPLTRLTRKDSVFQWDEPCENAFLTLKMKLCSAPILKFPDTTAQAGRFILDTDASDTSIGAVLSQIDANGQERVIAYGGRALNKNERNYCTTRKEMLALVNFLKHYRHYLLGRKFLVRTDHQSLIWLKNFKDAEGQIARWQELLQEYDFTCQHRPGKQHGNADALSRRPIRNHGDCPSCSAEHVTTVTLLNPEYETWSKLQSTDPETMILYHALKEGGERPSSNVMQNQSYETRCLWALWNQLVLDKGVMFMQHGPNYMARLIVPQSQVNVTLSKLHEELGHAGINKLERAARRRFWWPHQHRDVSNLCNSCPQCGVMKSPSHPNRAPLHPIKAGFPNEVVAMDIMGPMPQTSRRNRYILVLVDYFTKWCEAVPLSEVDATTVANAVLSHWICRWGAPSQLHSDRGANFESSLMLEICRALKIDKTRTTAYHPEGNGLVERTNRYIKTMLRVVTQKNPHSWDLSLPHCLMAYRSTVHKSTGQTPHFMWTGRELRLPIDLTLPTVHKKETFIYEYIQRMLDDIRLAHQTARTQLETTQRYQKDYHDKKCHGAPLVAGEKVWLKVTRPDPTVPAKFQESWKGPYTVEKVLSETNCIVRDITCCNGKPITVHFNQIKPYVEDIPKVPPMAVEVEVPPEGGVARAPGTSLS